MDTTNLYTEFRGKLQNRLTEIETEQARIKEMLDKISLATDDLESTIAHVQSSANDSIPGNGRRGHGKMSAAARKRISERMKAMWAKRKRAK